MKKLVTLIIVMTLCLSIVLIGFKATYANANGGNPPIGNFSMPNENDSEIDNDIGILSWYNGYVFSHQVRVTDQNKYFAGYIAELTAFLLKDN